MVERNPNPYRGQRPLARYRFEYERKRSVGKLVLVAVTGVSVIASVAGVSLALRPQAEPAALAVAKPKAETPAPLAFDVGEPTRVEALEAQPELPPAPAPASEIPPAPPPPLVIARAPAEAPRETPAAAAVSVSRPEEVAPEPAEVPPAPAPVVVAQAEPSPQRVAQAPAPDPCAVAAAAVERMVCADPELKAADQRLGAAFRRARQLADNPAALDRQQDRWLEQRDRLGADRTAVLAHYERRYQQLWPSRRGFPRIGAQLPGVIPWF